MDTMKKRYITRRAMPVALPTSWIGLFVSAFQENAGPFSYVVGSPFAVGVAIWVVTGDPRVVIPRYATSFLNI